jgi:hypothetical protein
MILMKPHLDPILNTVKTQIDMTDLRRKTALFPNAHRADIVFKHVCASIFNSWFSDSFNLTYDRGG